jgi:membrane-bound serine protease (ClpP class)
VIDTPGGLVDSTRSVVKEILRSEVPVVVYVAPSGARAASAGVFITLASHVAAMAPGTNIGAAHPVAIGGLPISPPATPAPQGKPQEAEKEDDTRQPTSPMEGKIVNDTTAWARALAELRGRNAEWAERAVRESLSVSASEAVRERVVDFEAQDLSDLLAQLDGREVRLPHGTVRLGTAGAPVRTHEMWWGERILAVIANPNMAFLLIIFGFYGILFELYSPGWGVAGTLGIVCLVLGFFALAVLPINYVGLVLVLLALAMFAAEAKVTSHGALALGGTACLVLGGLMLVDSPVGFLRVSFAVVAPVAAATALITFFLMSRIVKAHRARVQTGSEELLGAEAVAFDQFSQSDQGFSGTVRTHGEFWKATSAEPIAAGEVVQIEGRDGLTLRVRLAARQPSSYTKTDTHVATPHGGGSLPKVGTEQHLTT